MNSSHPEPAHTEEKRNRGELPADRAALTRVSVVVGFVVLIALAAGLVPRWRQRSVLARETRELAIPIVSVTKPAPAKAMSALALTAELKPLVEAPLYARASGYLKKIHVDIGSRVEAGQLLAEIDTPELDEELAQSQAQLAQTQAALELAESTAKRWADLLKTSSVSEQEAAEKAADLALKKANVAAARANMQRLENLRSFDRVTAPFAGTITSRRVDTGELVTSGGARELFRLAQTGKLRVFVHVPQGMARSVETGQTAEVTLPEFPKKKFTAKVARTSGAINPESRTLLCELELDNQTGELLAGSFAQVHLSDAKPEAALTIPGNALMFRAEGSRVAVVTDGRVELRRVSVGRDFGPTVEISNGIEAGDSVVLNPPDSLVDGMTVRVQEHSRDGTDKR
jgi:membrane fusion protein (multidrug efflux system)